MDRYWLWFCFNFFMNPAVGHAFLDFFGTPEAVFKESEENLLKAFPSHGKKISRVCTDREGWDYDKEVLKLERLGIHFTYLEEEAYPKRLKKIAVPPFGLFYRGSLPDERAVAAAMVGARDCTRYGINVSRWFAGDLAKAGVVVVSGMARGIDGASHRGALDMGGATFAVMGCGADICYPESNRDIYMEAEEKGGIISECPPGIRPLAVYFPQRNRIISGLSDVVLVVEARAHSGSLITADFALEQGKDVYAAPGYLNEPLSEGCNMLIKQGAGILITPEMLLEELGFSHEINSEGGNDGKNPLESPENPVYSCLSLRAAGLDEICSRTGLSAQDALKALSQLQLEGLAAEVYKNHYSRTG